MESNEYLSEDIGLCAYLICKGFKVLAIRQSPTHPRRSACVFEVAAESIALEYYQGGTVVARDYNRAAVDVNAMFRGVRR